MVTWNGSTSCASPCTRRAPGDHRRLDRTLSCCHRAAVLCRGDARGRQDPCGSAAGAATGRGDPRHPRPRGQARPSRPSRRRHHGQKSARRPSAATAWWPATPRAKLIAADATNPAHRGAVLGVVADAYSPGDDAVVQTGFVLEHTGWAWAPGPVPGRAGRPTGPGPARRRAIRPGHRPGAVHHPNPHRHQPTHHPCLNRRPPWLQRNFSA